MPAPSAKPTFSLALSVKPRFWASWRPRRPLDVQHGLWTGLRAPKTASRRASGRPRRPLDGHLGAQVGLWKGLLPPKTAKTVSRRASRRPRRPLEDPLGAQVGLWTGLLPPKTAFGRPCRVLSGLVLSHMAFSGCEYSKKLFKATLRHVTELHVHLAIRCMEYTGFTLVYLFICFRNFQGFSGDGGTSDSL